MDYTPPVQPPGGPMPPPPQIPRGRMRKRGFFSSMNAKQKQNAKEAFLIFLAFPFLICPMIFYGLYSLGILNYFIGGDGATEITESADRTAVEVQATVDKMAENLNPPTPIYITQTIIMEPPPTPTDTLTITETNATATAHANYSKPAIENVRPDIKLLIGSFTNKNIGHCNNSNVAFIGIDGTPYFLFFNEIDDLPDRDIKDVQVQLFAHVVAVSNCDAILLQVIDVRYPGLSSIEATPAPLSYRGRIITMSDGITATTTPPAIPDVAPTTDNPALAGIPYRGPDGTPLPTITPSASPTVPPVNLFGTTTAITGCLESNFGLATSAGEFIILFEGAAPPPADNPVGVQTTIMGHKHEICGRAAVRAIAANYVATATPVPSSGDSGSSSPSPTKTPTPSPTPVVVTLGGLLSTDSRGCDYTNYGLHADNGEFYYLQFSDIYQLEDDSKIVVRGEIHHDNCYQYMRVKDLSNPTRTPTSTQTPTTTPTQTMTPTPTPTTTPTSTQTTPTPTTTPPPNEGPAPGPIEPSIDPIEGN